MPSNGDQNRSPPIGAALSASRVLGPPLHAGLATNRRYSPAASSFNVTAASTLDPFALYTAFPMLGLLRVLRPTPSASTGDRSSPLRTTRRRTSRDQRSGSHVHYLKRSFLEGRSSAAMVNLNRQLTARLDSVANVRIHGTTGERPVDRYRDEEAHLGDADGRVAYNTRALLPRQVHHDSHLSLFGTRYSLHPVAVGKTVAVRLGSELEGEPLGVYLDDRLVATYRMATKGTRRVTLAEHARAIRELNRANGARGRRRSSTPRFTQSEQTEDTVVSFPSPPVQSPSLADYDCLAEPEYAS